ncbi:MAG: glutamate-cysteine ligase family protein [Myxococcales bacterium]|nr:glutamate-cysteine ligase family protein [Polyangiaceae bacterium]MDW8248903.1 glutamate-cysteine ligase family protein [Myxococcales bacterium]
MNKDQVLRSEAELSAIFHESEKTQDRWKIGAEAEKIGIFRETGAPVRYGDEVGIPAVLRALVERHGWEPEPETPGGPLIALRRGQGSVTLEPGGQLELSGTPWSDLHRVAAETRGHLEELRGISAELGIAWLGIGFHPTARQQDLDWVPKARYGIMKVYLPGRGAYGLDMMQRTTTVQVNLDYQDECDAIRKLRVALRLAPVTTAMFANSPFVEGQRWGGRSYRALTWLDVDNDRTGLIPPMWTKDAGYEHYIRWALDAPMFLFKRGTEVIENTGQTFRSFLRHGFQGHRATVGDWEMHLNTLFPEVRLKRTLEIRGADAQGSSTLIALPALWTGIFYDAQALADAEALCANFSYEEVAEARRHVPRLALQTPFRGATLLPLAQRLAEIAAAGLERRARLNGEGQDERCYLQPLFRLLEHGQSPADTLLSACPPGPLSLPALLEHTELT